MVENSWNELSDCESVLESHSDLQTTGRDDRLLLHRLLESKPDVVLLADYELVDTTISLIYALLERKQGRILVIGPRRVDREIMDLLEAGANGFLDKRFVSLHLEKAVRCIFAGETWVSRKVVALVLDRLRHQSGN